MLRTQAKPLGKIINPDDLWKDQLHTELKLLNDVTKAIGKVEQKLDKISQADPQVKILQTIAGVGPRVAKAIVAFIDNHQRF